MRSRGGFWFCERISVLFGMMAVGRSAWSRRPWLPGKNEGSMQSIVRSCRSCCSSVCTAGSRWAVTVPGSSAPASRLVKEMPYESGMIRFTMPGAASTCVSTWWRSVSWCRPSEYAFLYPGVATRNAQGIDDVVAQGLVSSRTWCLASDGFSIVLCWGADSFTPGAKVVFDGVDLPENVVVGKLRLVANWFARQLWPDAVRDSLLWQLADATGASKHRSGSVGAEVFVSARAVRSDDRSRRW